MKPEYSHHARVQMTRRRISEAEVEFVLDRHHTAYSDKAGNPILIGDPSKRRIKVVYAKDSAPPFVITVGD